MLDTSYNELAGFLGVALYLGSYAALQLGFLRGNGYTYAFLNLAAACAILVSLSVDFNLWSAAIQISWIVISVVGMTRLYVLTRRLTFSPEERELVGAKFPDLEPLLARRLMSAGSWSAAVPGTVLATEGMAVPALVYLRSGSARVTVAGREVGICGPGSLVGEFGAMTGTPAIATVTLDVPSSIFSVRSADLSALMTRYPAIRMAIGAAIGLEARTKFIAANTRSAAE